MAMKFIDFFAGIGGIRLGLERAGHECVGFCEFDKFARQSYKAMHNTEGEWENHDIRTASSYGLPKADLWTFGFPCQDLSVAGKRKGLQEGERSGLFYEIIRLLQGLRQEDRPKWLLAENVKGLFSAGGGFDFLRCIVELGGLGYSVEWQLLNSKDFGVPQNRERVFIVGHLGEGSGREVFPIRPADGENTCRLQEITKGVADSFRIYKSEGIARTLKSEGGGLGAKMGLYAVDAIYNNREPRVTDIAPTLRADRQGLCVGGDIRVIGNYSPSGHEASRVLDPTGIAPTVMENHGTVNAVAIDLTENNPKITETARCLKARYTAGVTNFSGDNSGVLVKEATTAQDRHGVAIHQLGHGFNKGGTHEIAPTLTGSAYHNNNVLKNGVRIRKLTPRECWRLQGFPDEYFDKAVAAGVSNSQLYKQSGNAVSVPVAEAIGRRLREIEMAVSE